MKRKRKIRFAGAVLFLTMFCGMFTTAGAASSQKELEVSYKNRTAVKQAILDIIEENKDLTPSVSVKVFDNKKDICSVVYGKASIKDDLNADKNTVYEWGSVSKLLVWTSAMQLYEQGELDLDKDIKEYLPKDFLSNLSYDDPITMTDLMNHSAGFQETVAKIESEDKKDLLPLKKALSTTAPAQVARPGETVSYSNWGAALGGYVVSYVSGMDYAEYVKKNIFNKLGMKHTYIRPDATDNEWAAEKRKSLHCYTIDMDTNKLTDLGECRRYINLYPAGSAGGTISDMATFAKAFLADSKSCPLFKKKDTLKKMLSASRTFDDGTKRICHGFFYTLSGTGVYGHGGNTEGCSADLEFDLKKKTGYVMMTNMQSDHIYTPKLLETLYKEKTIPVKSDFEKIDLSGYYKMGRSSGGAGLLTIVSPFEDYFTVTKTGDTYVGSNGVTKITQINDSFVEMELINGKKKYMGIKKDTEGKLSGMESFQAIDYLKVTDFKYYTDWAMEIVFFAPIVIMSLLAIIHLIRLRKFKRTPLESFKRAEFGAALCSLLMLIELVVIVEFSYFFFYSGLIMYAAVSILLCMLALIEVINILRCLSSREKPRRKFLLALETLFSLMTVSGIAYWHLYQFWGF